MLFISTILFVRLFQIGLIFPIQCGCMRFHSKVLLISFELLFEFNYVDIWSRCQVNSVGEWLIILILSIKLGFLPWKKKWIDKFIYTETMAIFQLQLFFIILNNLDFDPKFFWAWTDFQSYLDFMLAVWFVGAIITYFMLPFTMFMESVGFMAVFIEAMLGKLTVVRLYDIRRFNWIW